LWTINVLSVVFSVLLLEDCSKLMESLFIAVLFWLVCEEEE